MPSQPKLDCGLCDLALLCQHDMGNEISSDNPADCIISKRQLETGQALYRAGDSSHKIFAVSMGSFKSTITDAQGNEQITGFFLPGDLIGLDGIGNIPSSTTIIALESSAACSVPEPVFNQQCSANQELHANLMQTISTEITRKQKHILTLAKMDASQRLASFLIDISSRLQNRGLPHHKFCLTMTRNDIANYLGLASATLSRLFRVFQQKGYLQARRHAITLNRDYLCSKLDINNPST